MLEIWQTTTTRFAPRFAPRCRFLVANTVLNSSHLSSQAVKRVLMNGVEASFIWKVGDGAKRKDAFKLRFEEVSAF